MSDESHASEGVQSLIRKMRAILCTGQLGTEDLEQLLLLTLTKFSQAQSKQEAWRALRPRVVPSEDVRCLVWTNFLNSLDLGRLVFFTSKSISDTVGNEDEMWAALCRSRWPSTAKLLIGFLRKRGFWHLFFGMERKGLRPEDRHSNLMPPPRLSSDNLVRMVDVFTKKHGRVYSDAFSSEKLSGMLQNGMMEIDITDSHLFDVSNGLFSGDEGFIFVQVKLLDLHHGKVYTVIGKDEKPTTLGSGNDMDSVCAHAECTFSTGLLNFVEKGLLNFDRINHKYQLLVLAPQRHAHLRMDGIEITVDINFSSAKELGIVWPEFPTWNDQNMQWKVSKIGIQVIKHCSMECIPYERKDWRKAHPHWQRKHFDSTIEATVHGVTLSHLLENLDGWM